MTIVSSVCERTNPENICVITNKYLNLIRTVARENIYNLYFALRINKITGHFSYKRETDNSIILPNERDYRRLRVRKCYNYKYFVQTFANFEKTFENLYI